MPGLARKLARIELVGWKSDRRFGLYGFWAGDSGREHVGVWFYFGKITCGIVAVGKCRWMLGARVEHSVFDEYRLTTLQAAWLYGTNWWLLAENWCKEILRSVSKHSPAENRKATGGHVQFIRMSGPSRDRTRVAWLSGGRVPA